MAGSSASSLARTRLSPGVGFVGCERRQELVQHAPGRMRGEQSPDARERIGHAPHRRDRRLIDRRTIRPPRAAAQHHETGFHQRDIAAPK